MATVDQLITQAQGFANSANTQAANAISRMQADVDRLGFTVIGFEAPTLPVQPAIPAPLTAPLLAPIDMDLPADPAAAPAYQDISPVEVGTAPTLDSTAPTMTLPNLPTAVPQFSGVMPGLDTNIAFPVAPTIDFNELAPTITDRAAPTRPQVMLPVFDATAPGDLAAAPTDYAERFVAAYREVAPEMVTALDGYLDAMLAKMYPNYHAGVAAIETQLSRFLAGGTGFSPPVEDAIYTRSRSKNAADARRTMDAAWEEAAHRGFTLPDGVLNASLNLSRQGAADNNAAGAREIVVMVAEQEQKNLQFAVTASAGMRQSALSAALAYHGNLVQINGQALDYAKGILGAIVQLYETTMKAYAARVEAWKAEAVVYETKLKAAMSGIELYKADIQALEALTQVDRARIDVFKARIEVDQARAAIYRSNIEAIVARMSVEKLKVEIFQAEVQAYGAQVNGKQAEYMGYKAAIEGQQALVSAHAEEVRTFGIRTDAWRAEIAAKTDVLRSIATTNEARSRQYSAMLEGYRVLVSAKGEVARVKLENQRQEIMAFETESRTRIASAQLQNDWYKSVAQVIIENSRLGVQTVIESARENVERSRAVAALGTGAAQVYASFASSAMSGMNTLVSQQLTE